MSWSSTLLTALVVAAAAVFVHEYVLLSGPQPRHNNDNGTTTSPPPADFGSGSMFDVIAHRYDAINRALALGMDIGWRQHMVTVVAERITMTTTTTTSTSTSTTTQQAQTVQVQQPRILDVATGTADVALILAGQIPTAIVLGVDPSPNMLQVGREKIATRGLTERITLQQADARQGLLDVVGTDKDDDDDNNKQNNNNGSVTLFDAATMAFGIRNIVQKEQALCQIHAVLKDEATFCILEFSEPDESFGILGAAARLFIRHVIPTMGGLLSGKPREYWHLQASIQDFPTPIEFVRLLERVTCPTGTFRVDDLQQLNFGSVQLYVMTKVPVAASASEDHEPEIETATEKKEEEDGESTA